MERDKNIESLLQDKPTTESFFGDADPNESLTNLESQLESEESLLESDDRVAAELL